MRLTVVRLAVAIVVGAVGWLSWREAGLVDSAADARMQLALLRYEAAAGEVPDWTLSDALLNDARPLAAGARRDRAVAGYWQGRLAGAMEIDVSIGALAQVDRQDVDPELLLIAANGSFRASQREGSAGPAAVQRLDGVLQAYAAVLEASPRGLDAAYNYEFVARIRDAIARGGASRSKAEMSPPLPVRTRASDLPTGPTLHGVSGAPPPEVKAEEFQIIAPMEFGDREAQPEPTPGAKPTRKG